VRKSLVDNEPDTSTIVGMIAKRKSRDEAKQEYMEEKEKKAAATKSKSRAASAPATATSSSSSSSSKKGSDGSREKKKKEKEKDKDKGREHTSRKGESSGKRRKDKKKDKKKAPARAHLRNVYQQPLPANVDMSKAHKSEKNAVEKELIHAALSKNFVFSDLSKESLQPLVEAFEPCSFSRGGVIIRQGDPGDYFYILKRGKVIFQVNGNDVGSAKKGASFGELSLLYTVRFRLFVTEFCSLPCLVSCPTPPYCMSLGGSC